MKIDDTKILKNDKKYLKNIKGMIDRRIEMNEWLMKIGKLNVIKRED